MAATIHGEIKGWGCPSLGIDDQEHAEHPLCDNYKHDCCRHNGECQRAYYMGKEVAVARLAECRWLKLVLMDDE